MKGTSDVPFRGRVTRERPWWLLPVVILTVPLWLPAAILVIAAGAVWRGAIYAVVWASWIGGAPRRALFVYSNSPNWKEYVEAEILPRLPAGTVVLNWSARSEWPAFSLPAILFRTFAGRTEFNPIALVFERGRLVERYRFWQPFRDAKHGRHESLRAMTEALMVRLTTGAPDASVGGGPGRAGKRSG